MANYESTHTGAWHDNQLSIDELFDRIYPIGSIYISMNETDPGTLFGGTWERISGRFLLGCGGTGPGANNYTGFGSLTTAQETLFSDLQPGSTGGEYFHTLSVAEMPAHNHAVFIFNANNQNFTAMRANGSGGWDTAPSGARLPSGHVAWQSASFKTAGSNYSGIGTGDFAGNTDIIGSTWGHNNMPPYLTVCMWQRIS